MTRADLLAKSREHERTALSLHLEGRVRTYFDQPAAAALAWEHRDIARRMSLETLADAEVAT